MAVAVPLIKPIVPFAGTGGAAGFRPDFCPRGPVSAEIRTRSTRGGPARRAAKSKQPSQPRGYTMERFPWPPRFGRAAIARALVIAAVTALALAVLAAAGMAATSGTNRGAAPLAPGPNGCPTNKSLKTAPIADIAPPARLQIVAFEVLSGPINAQTQTFTMKVRIGSTCSVNIKGASVYVTAVPYNQFTIPEEVLTGDDGNATLVFRRDANFPASSKQQQLTLFVRATKPGEDKLAGVSTRRLVAFNFSS
jgi:hypothetical protein